MPGLGHGPIVLESMPLQEWGTGGQALFFGRTVTVALPPCLLSLECGARVFCGGTPSSWGMEHPAGSDSPQLMLRASEMHDEGTASRGRRRHHQGTGTKALPSLRTRERPRHLHCPASKDTPSDQLLCCPRTLLAN